MPHKIVLIGAGSANFGLGIMGDLLKSQVFAGSKSACTTSMTRHWRARRRLAAATSQRTTCRSR